MCLHTSTLTKLLLPPSPDTLERHVAARARPPLDHKPRSPPCWAEGGAAPRRGRPRYKFPDSGDVTIRAAYATAYGGPGGVNIYPEKTFRGPPAPPPPASARVSSALHSRGVLLGRKRRPKDRRKLLTRRARALRANS